MNERKDERTIVQLAREAMDVQNACNLSGVVHSYSRTLTRLRALLESGEGRRDGDGCGQLNTHPIAQVWADKIASLTRTQTLGNDATLVAFRWTIDLIVAESAGGASHAAE